ncbi:MAG: glutamyl-tRNA synthetase [Candidatus Xenolissoclinum pacificiensis L6]|uniref:Glutamyl-tRNA synthetase n=1 Tax=Candidatus Xenolissoclinum pacificiensis L6 TaxID=1401685 RepID=W2UYR2_9RICK|nr:MAG: glutamyl-tRNA synthetase [Candidatus Xenolissoclinum pacificiensis L6]
MSFLGRFAPSPTGLLHVGNARTALLNFLHMKSIGGDFLLRIDNTDSTRSKQEYIGNIKSDLQWLNINWKFEFSQSDRTSRYDEIFNQLLAEGKIYPCFETPEELQIKSSLMLKMKKPPIYDRASLKLSTEEIDILLNSGKKPHYRFLLDRVTETWNDGVHNDISIDLSHTSDPVLKRTNGQYTYMLPSTIDDLDYKITHIIRGDDHIVNTAIQIQIIRAILRDASIPIFSHVPLMLFKEGKKLSKRNTDISLEQIRNKYSQDPMVLSSYLALLGSTNNIKYHSSLEDIATKFNLNNCSVATPVFDINKIVQLNTYSIRQLDDIAINRLLSPNLEITPEYWNTIRNNISNIQEVREWWYIFTEQITIPNNIISTINKDIIDNAVLFLPNSFSPQDIKKWSTQILSNSMSCSPRDVFKNLRLSLTGLDYGPELTTICSFLTHDKVKNRLMYVIDKLSKII